jgi:uncharacterized membrane protein YvbJ
MKYCSHCGAELQDETFVCPKCGCQAENNSKKTVEKENNIAEGSTFGWGVLGFFVPICGLVLYLVWKDSKPLSAKAAGRGALIQVIVASAIYFLYIMFVILMIILVLGFGVGVAKYGI